MKAARGPLLVTAAVLLGISPQLRAQTLPLPELPAETPVAIDAPRPSASPGAGVSALVEASGPVEPARPGPWQLSLGAGLGWDDNIDFQVADGPSDVMLVPRAGIARVFRHRHGELRAAASGLWTGYRDHRDLRRYYGDFGIDGHYGSSTRTRWQGSATYGIGDSASARILREQGVALPRVKTRAVAANLGFSRSLGGRSTLRVDGRVHGTEFDSPELLDGGSARLDIGLQREMGDRSALELAYGAEHVVKQGPDGSYLTHFASLQWARVLSRGTAILIEGGASSTPDTVRAGLDHGESFYGGATLMRRGRRSQVRLFVRHEVAPAFGTGESRLDLRAGLGAAIPIGRSWELGIETSHVEPAGTPRFAQGSSYDGFASLGLRVGRWLEVSGEGRYRRLGPGAETPAIQELQAGVFLSLFTNPVRGNGLLR